MPDPRLNSILSDPDFVKLSPSDQRGILTHVTGDAAFGKLQDAETRQYVTHARARIVSQNLPQGSPSPLPPLGILPGQLSRTTQGPLDPLYNTVINAGEWAGKGLGNFALGAGKRLIPAMQSALPGAGEDAQPAWWNPPPIPQPPPGPLAKPGTRKRQFQDAMLGAQAWVSRAMTPQGYAQKLGAETMDEWAKWYGRYLLARGGLDVARGRLPDIPLRSLKKPFPLRPGEQQVTYRTTPSAAQAGTTPAEALKDLASEAMPAPLGKSYRIVRGLRKVFGGRGLPVSEGAPYPARSVADMKPEERAAFLSQQAFPSQPLGVQSAGLGQTPVSTQPVPPPSGAQLGQLAQTEAATAPAVTSPVRTMPGQVSAETVWQRPMSGFPGIEGQPPQRGLALPGQVAAPSAGLGQVPVKPYTPEELASGRFTAVSRPPVQGLGGLAEQETLARTTAATNRANEIEFGLQELESYPLGKDKARYIRREMAKDRNYDPVKLLKKHLDNLRPVYGRQWKGPKFVGKFEQGGIIPTEQVVPAAYDPFIWQYLRGVL